MARDNKVTLMSSECDLFSVDEVVAFELQTVKNMIDDIGSGTYTAIPLPNVTSSILSKVIEYCKYHVELQKTDIPEDEIKVWDGRFVSVDLATIIDLISAASYLNIESFLELTCQTTVDMIKGKTAEEIRRMFNIPNDFTLEEEEQIRRENQWTLE